MRKISGTRISGLLTTFVSTRIGLTRPPTLTSLINLLFPAPSTTTHHSCNHPSTPIFFLHPKTMNGDSATSAVPAEAPSEAIANTSDEDLYNLLQSLNINASDAWQQDEYLTLEAVNATFDSMSSPR